MHVFLFVKAIRRATVWSTRRYWVPAGLEPATCERMALSLALIARTSRLRADPPESQDPDWILRHHGVATGDQQENGPGHLSFPETDVGTRKPVESEGSLIMNIGLRAVPLACLIAALLAIAARGADLSHSLALIFDDGAGNTLPYRLFLPPGHDQPGASHPLVLFLHGAGERGTDNVA